MAVSIASPLTPHCCMSSPLEFSSFVAFSLQWNRCFLFLSIYRDHPNTIFLRLTTSSREDLWLSCASFLCCMALVVRRLSWFQDLITLFNQVGSRHVVLSFARMTRLHIASEGEKNIENFELWHYGFVVGRHSLSSVNLSGSLLFLSVVVGRRGKNFGLVRDDRDTATVPSNGLVLGCASDILF